MHILADTQMRIGGSMHGAENIPLAEANRAIKVRANREPVPTVLILPTYHYHFTTPHTQFTCTHTHT